MNARISRAGLAVAVVVLLGLTGCGGGASTTTGIVAQPPQTSGDSTTTAPAEPTPDRQADEAITRAALVQLSDLPAGWTAHPDEAEDFHCPAVEAVERNPRTQTDRFDAPTGDRAAQHEVVVLATEDAADAALDELVSQETLDCLAREGEEGVRRQAAAGTEVGHVTAARLVNVSPSGDRAAGARLTYPVSANGIDVTVHQDLLFTRVGRGLSLFAIVAQGVTPDEALSTDLAHRGAQRLRDALGDA